MLCRLFNSACRQVNEMSSWAYNNPKDAILNKKTALLSLMCIGIAVSHYVLKNESQKSFVNLLIPSYKDVPANGKKYFLSGLFATSLAIVAYVAHKKDKDSVRIFYGSNERFDMNTSSLFGHIEKISKDDLTNAAKAAKNAADQARAAASEAKHKVDGPLARKQAVEKAHFFAFASIVNAGYADTVHDNYIGAYSQYSISAMFPSKDHKEIAKEAKAYAREAVNAYNDVFQDGDPILRDSRLNSFSRG